MVFSGLIQVVSSYPGLVCFHSVAFSSKKVSMGSYSIDFLFIWSVSLQSWQYGLEGVSPGGLGLIQVVSNDRCLVYFPSCCVL